MRLVSWSGWRSWGGRLRRCIRPAAAGAAVVTGAGAGGARHPHHGGGGIVQAASAIDDEVFGSCHAKVERSTALARAARGGGGGLPERDARRHVIELRRVRTLRGHHASGPHLQARMSWRRRLLRSTAVPRSGAPRSRYSANRSKEIHAAGMPSMISLRGGTTNSASLLPADEELRPREQRRSTMQDACARPAQLQRTAAAAASGGAPWPPPTAR